MAQAFHVNGPAYMYAAVGTNNAWTALGYTEAGVDVEVTSHWTPVMCDAAGVEVPADLQRMGRSAVITAPMVAWDWTTLDAIEKRGSLAAVGSEGTVGELMGTGASAFGFGRYADGPGVGVRGRDGHERGDGRGPHPLRSHDD